MPRPDPLTPSARRVVNASRNLDATSKLVWSEISMLDRGPDGCYCRPDTLAARVGVSRETLERQRRALLDAGLLAKAPRKGYGDAWFAILPAECIPERRPGEADVLALAVKLDTHLRNGTKPHEPGVTHVTKLVGNLASRMTPESPQPGVTGEGADPPTWRHLDRNLASPVTPPLSSESTDNYSVLRAVPARSENGPTARTDNGNDVSEVPFGPEWEAMKARLRSP